MTVVSKRTMEFACLLVFIFVCGGSGEKATFQTNSIFPILNSLIPGKMVFTSGQEARLILISLRKNEEHVAAHKSATGIGIYFSQTTGPDSYD